MGRGVGNLLFKVDDVSFSEKKKFATDNGFHVYVDNEFHSCGITYYEILLSDYSEEIIWSYR